MKINVRDMLEMLDSLGGLHQEVQQRCRRHQVLVELLRSWEIPAGEGALLLIDSALSIALTSKRENTTIEELVETLRAAIESRLKNLTEAYRDLVALGEIKDGAAGKEGAEAKERRVPPEPPGGVN